MSGKGDKIRPFDKVRYNDNYDRINWARKKKQCPRGCVRFAFHDEGRIKCTECGTITGGVIAVTANGVGIRSVK